MALLAKPLALLSLVFVAFSAQAASEFYCCPDANGRRTCGDTLPESCRGKAYKVLDTSGNVLREVAPPLTAEQKAQIAAQEKQRQEQEAIVRIQRRKDQALLDTYSSVKDIDVAQKQAETNLLTAIAADNAQIDVIREQRKKYEREAEFYKKKALPADIARGLREADYAIKLLEENLKLKRRDFETITNKYEADRRRYIEIAGRPAPADKR